MDVLPILEFITQRYQECKDETERDQVSTLYWTVLSYGLHGITDVPFRQDDILTSPILN